MYKYLMREIESMVVAIDEVGTTNADKLSMEAQILQIQIILKDFPLNK